MTAVESKPVVNAFFIGEKTWLDIERRLEELKYYYLMQVFAVGKLWESVTLWTDEKHEVRFSKW